MADRGLEDLLRPLAGQVLGVLVRRYGQFDACEDAVQEALLDASVQWPDSGVPENPKGWLVTVASRRLTDQWRSESARRRREATVAALEPPAAPAGPLPGDELPGDELAGDELAGGQDDTLTLLFLCCHPALAPASQVALTLRALGGLTTAEIARAFLVPEATMAQRISRAKQRIKASGTGFRLPSQPERSDRLPVVLQVLYLIFNEGYTASSGPGVHRAELTVEAIRLTRAVHALLPHDGEVTGLLALMLLTDARRPARTSADGELIPLAEQDRSLWHRDLITEGDELIMGAVEQGAVGEYQLQAAIAALHDDALRVEATDWPQILGLYGLLARMTGNPMVTLNQAVAAAMVHGPAAGLAMLAPLDERLAGHYRLDAVRAHLYELAGDTDTAIIHYRAAANRTTSVPERNYLTTQAARLLHAQAMVTPPPAEAGGFSLGR